MRKAAVERLEAIFARLDARASDERVFVKLCRESARAAALASDRRMAIGSPLGPLDGRIVSIKDLLDVSGEQTLVGSVIRADAPPAVSDALVVQRLRAAGAVIIGKTHLTEFCFTSDGVNNHYGTPPNARDASRIPGGSSSGAGVSAAEGTSEIAIGSDTGGSVRIPAALNGVVGFKPTAKRVPLVGAFPLSPSLDSIGPLAGSVADCARADAVMAGEPPWSPEPAALSGLRFGIPEGRLFDGLDDAVAAAFDGRRKRLERAGVRIAPIDIEDLLDGLRWATQDGSIASIEAAEVHADWLTTAVAAQVNLRVAGPLSRRLAVPAWRYLRTMRQRRALAAAMDTRLAGIDALMLPTVPFVAPLLAPLLASQELLDRVDGLLLRNTQIANQFDLTAISLPVPDTALPIGLSLMARHGHDRRLLSIAAAIERLG